MYALAVIVAVAVPGQADLQGTWRGTGLDARYSLVFCEQYLAGHVGTNPILRPLESTFTVDPAEGTIDITRDDGLQLGRYAIDGDTLTLMLADVNLTRPNSINFRAPKPSRYPVVIDRKSWKPPTQSRYVFERVR